MQRQIAFPTAVLALTLAACTSTSGGSLAHYFGAVGVNVSTRCGGGYRVFRYNDEPKVLVAAYAVSEAYKSVCERHNPNPVVQSVTGLRHEEAVTEYFLKTPGLQRCRITGGTEITALHSEFTFSCPVQSALAPSSRT